MDESAIGWVDALLALDEERLLRIGVRHAAKLGRLRDKLALVGGHAPSPRAPGERYGDAHKIAQGSMGAVFRVRDRILDRDVVLKVLSPDPSGEEGCASPDEIRPPSATEAGGVDYESYRARFVEEARIAADLEHPGVVPVYDLGETPAGVPYQVLRMIRTERTLAGLLADAGRSHWRERRRLLDPFLDACDTIAYAHANEVMHRDLKPDNIMVGEFGQVFVVDWGLARRLGAPSDAARTPEDIRDRPSPRTPLTGIAGTPGYIAPEVLLQRTRYPDPRQDVYALGVILYEILAGRSLHPRVGLQEYLEWMKAGGEPSFEDVPWEPPPALVACCRDALDPDPERRLASVKELIRRIRLWREEEILEKLALRVEADFQAAAEAPEAQRLAIADRAGANLERLRRQGGAASTVDRLQRDLDELRARIHDEAIRLQRRRLLRTAGLLGLLVFAVAGVLVSLSLEARRKEVSAAYERASAAAENARRAQERTQSALGLALQAREAAETAKNRAASYGLVSASREVQLDDPALSYALANRAACCAGPPPERAVTRLHEAFAHLTEIRRIDASPTAVTAADWSPDHDLLVTGDAAGTLAGRSLDGTLTWTAEAHTDAVTTCVLSPDGSRILTTSRDGSARLWKADGTPVATLEGHEGPVLAGAFSPSGRQVATAGADGDVRIWNADGTSAGVLGGPDHGHQGEVGQLLWLPNGKGIVTGSRDGTARLWREDGKQWMVLNGHVGGVTSLATDAEGRFLLTGSMDGAVRLWDMKGVRLQELRAGEDAFPVLCVAVSPSGDLLVAGREDGSVAMWSEKGELQASMQVHEGPVRHIAFARAGLRVLTGSDDRTICAWDRTGRLVASHHGHHGGITKLLVAPGRGGFASASEDGTVRFWAWYGHEVFTRSEPGDPLTGVVPGPDDGSFVTWSDGVVRAWRPGATTPLPVARLPEGCRRWAAVAGAQGPFAALCAEGALVVDASGGRTEIPLPEGEAPSHTAFLPDGRGLLLAWPSGRVLVRPDAGPERVLSTETGVAVVAVSVSPDGALAAYGNAEGLVRVQDLEDGREVWSRRIGEAVNDVVLSPDGRRLAIAAAAAPVRVYSLDDDRRWPYADDLQDATAVRWDHGGASLLIGTPDGTMHRRNEAGDDLAIYRAPDGPLQAVAASADGRLVATLSRTGVFRVWHATAESLLQEARARPPRALTPAERARYQDVLPPRGGG